MQSVEVCTTPQVLSYSHCHAACWLQQKVLQYLSCRATSMSKRGQGRDLNHICGYILSILSSNASPPVAQLIRTPDQNSEHPGFSPDWISAIFFFLHPYLQRLITPFLILLPYSNNAMLANISTTCSISLRVYRLSEIERLPTLSIPTLSIPIWSTSHFINSNFVNFHLVNVDKVGIDKVGS